MKCYEPLSNFDFKFNLRRYSLARTEVDKATDAANRAATSARLLAAEKRKESDPAWRAMQVKRQALPAGRCRLTLSNPRCNLKAPGTERLKLEYDKLLSSFAFRVNSRRYIPAFAMRTELIDAIEGGACPRYTPCIPL